MHRILTGLRVSLARLILAASKLSRTAHDPSTLNASIYAESSRIPVCVGSVGEAELASAFGNAKIGHDESTIPRNCGYPPPTPIFCDNECTIGLSNDAVRKKQSKSMDLPTLGLAPRPRSPAYIYPTLHPFPP
jgi:hypothetical protein